MVDVQPNLFEMGEFVTDGIDRKASIQEQFAAFHRLNPWVYVALVRLARDLVARGRKKVGMKMLFEVLRWQYQRSTTGDDFKLNNNYTARYARLIEDREPDLVGLFEKREIRTP